MRHITHDQNKSHATESPDLGNSIVGIHFFIRAAPERYSSAAAKTPMNEEW